MSRSFRQSRVIVRPDCLALVKSHSCDHLPKFTIECLLCSGPVLEDCGYCPNHPLRSWMLEDVPANRTANRSRLTGRMEVLKQVQIRHSRSAGNNDGYRDRLDDLGERVYGAGPVALHNVSSEFRAKTGASLQV